MPEPDHAFSHENADNTLTSASIAILILICIATYYYYKPADYITIYKHQDTTMHARGKRYQAASSNITHWVTDV